MKLIGFALSLSIGILAFQSADPYVGTWKVNVAKSSYVPGPAPKSNTAVYEAVQGGYKQTQDGIDAGGNPTHTVTNVILDGKDHPVQGNPNADTVAFTRPDARTIASTWKKGGKVLFTATNVVSADGKVRTVTQKGTDAQGRAMNNVMVYEKQ